jgi:hypothetical protein
MIMLGQQIVDTVDFVLYNAAEDIGELSRGIDLVELRCLDEGIGSRRRSTTGLSPLK